jgi:hypothetical protein
MSSPAPVGSSVALGTVDAKFDGPGVRHIDILFDHAALNFDGAAYGIYNAPELNESAVTMRPR